MRSRTSSFSTAALQQGSSFICTAHLFTTADHRTHFLSSRHGAAATQQMTEQISPASFFFFIFKGSSLSPYDSRYIWTTLVVLCVNLRLPGVWRLRHLLPSLLPRATRTSGDGVCREREPKESRLSNESSRPWRGGERESLRSESQQSM